MSKLLFCDPLGISPYSSLIFWVGISLHYALMKTWINLVLFGLAQGVVSFLMFWQVPLPKGKRTCYTGTWRRMR